CFNKSKGVLITGSKLKAFRNPQPSWGFSVHKKTTRRWFHDTAYCFDFILIFPMVPGAGLEPAQRERRGILKTINHHL
ncbi:TPA: hypothetical protein ACGBQF_002158, partial [Escherichia coli]